MPTPDTLLEAARSVVPELATRAQEAEALRHAPEANVKALLGAGLTRILQPTGFGGAGLGVGTQVQVSAALGRGCVSTAWCQFVWGVHQFLISLYPAEAHAEVWGAAPETLTSASLNPSGRARREGDQWILDGRWSFASGCDWADWLLLGAIPEDEAEPPQLLLVPKAETEIIDTWFVSGLRGTGSKDVACEGVAVPAYRSMPFTHSIVAYLPLLTVVIAAPLLGGAEAAVAGFEKRLVDRQLVTGGAQKEKGTAKARLAESSAEVDAARLLLERVCAEIDAGDVPELVPRQLRDCGFAGRLMVRAVQRLFEASGGGSLQESNPMQRIWRDVTAGSTHAFLTWDNHAENYADAVLASASEPS